MQKLATPCYQNNGYLKKTVTNHAFHFGTKQMPDTTGSQSLSYDGKLIEFYEINSVSLFISYVLAI